MKLLLTCLLAALATSCSGSDDWTVVVVDAGCYCATTDAVECDSHVEPPADPVDAAGEPDAGPVDAAPTEAAGEAADDTTADVPSPDSADSAIPLGRTCMPTRWVLAGQIRNARDLGGVPLFDGTRVPCGLVYRGTPLAGLSEQGCADVEAIGIRTVVDLRTPAEVEPLSACVAARVVSAPMSPIALLDVTDAVRSAFEALGDPAAYPVYLSCARGTDRTGAVAALVLLALGASESDVVAEYRLSESSGLPTDVDMIWRALDTVRAAGGIDAYLASAGVQPERVAALRAIAR